MSRGFVYEFEVIAASAETPSVDTEGRWEPETVTQHVRGALGFDKEILRDVTNPTRFDLVALVPAGTSLIAPTIVRVPAGYENVASPGDYIVQERQPVRLHVRLLCAKHRTAE